MFRASLVIYFIPYTSTSVPGLPLASAGELPIQDPPDCHAGVSQLESVHALRYTYIPCVHTYMVCVDLCA